MPACTEVLLNFTPSLPFFTLSFDARMAVASHLSIAAVARPSLTTAKSLRAAPRAESILSSAGSPAVLSKILVGI